MNGFCAEEFPIASYPMVSDDLFWHTPCMLDCYTVGFRLHIIAFFVSDGIFSFECTHRTCIIPHSCPACRVCGEMPSLAGNLNDLNDHMSAQQMPNAAWHLSHSKHNH